MYKKVKKIAIEGMIGAGKTTSLVKLAKRLGSSILLSEINYMSESIFPTYIPDDWRIFHQLWLERMNIINRFDKNKIFLLDRTYYSNLAFSYALDQFTQRNSFSLQKKMIEDFSKDDFDIIIVLDVYPRLGLNRRSLPNHNPAWPWSEIKFLEYYREFYTEKIFHLNSKIEVIKTDFIPLEEILKMILMKIKKVLPDMDNLNQANNISKLQEKQLILEGNKRKTGLPYCNGFFVMGYPTMYFRMYGLQLDNNRAFILNNNRLRYLADKVVL